MKRRPYKPFAVAHLSCVRWTRKHHDACVCLANQSSDAHRERAGATCGCVERHPGEEFDWK